MPVINDIKLSAEFLNEKYIVQLLSDKEIALMSGFPYTYISAWRKHYNIRRTPNFNKRNYTIAELDDMKINTKTCPFCNEKLIIKTINDQVKSQYLFINRPLKLILLVHRRCKPKASQPEIYQKILKIIELRKLENK